MPAEIGSYLTFEEIRGARSTLEELRHELTKFDRDGVVFICSAINCLLTNSRDHGVAVQEELLSEAFPPASLGVIKELRREHDESQRFVFHRRQLLLVAKEAIRVCSSGGVDPRKEPFWGGLGMPLLMANDHLHFGLRLGNYSQEISEEGMLAFLSEFIPISEYAVGMWSFMNAVARWYLMMTRFAEGLRGRKEFVDFPVEFWRIAGFSLRDYLALAVGVTSNYLTLDVHEFRRNPSSFFLSEGRWYGQTAVDACTADTFLKSLSATGEEMRRALLARDFGANDFTFIRKTPMLSSGEQHYPIDPLLLSEKLQAGPFWLLNDGLDAAGRNKLRAFWGLVFQAYAQWLLDNAVDGVRNVFIPSPTYLRDGMEACDALVCCGSSLILLEFKASMFTAEAKYAGRPDILAEEIDKKLGGVSAGKRGIPQLAACISKLFDKKSPSKITNVDLSGVRTIYPVLVTADDLGGALVINMYLANRFRRIFNVRSIRPRKVAPLFCMSIEDLEKISGYLKETELAEILDSRYRFDPSLKSSFAAAENEVLARIGKRTNLALEKAFAEAMDSACERLFPGKTLEHAYLKNTSNPPQR